MAFSDQSDFAVTQLMRDVRRLKKDVSKLQTLPPYSAGSSAGGGGYTQEEIEDIVGAMVGGASVQTAITVSYDDTNGELDFEAIDWTVAQPSDIDAANIPDLSGTYQVVLSEGAFTDGDKTKLDSLLDWTADQGATDINAANIPDLSATYMKVLASFTDNAVVKIDNAVNMLQQTGVTIDDSNNISTVGSVTGGNIIANGTVYVDRDAAKYGRIFANGIDLGYQGEVGGDSYIHFFGEGGAGVVYDGKIFVSGGIGSNGGGDMYFYANDFIFDHFPTTPSSEPTEDYDVVNKKYVVDGFQPLDTLLTNLSDDLADDPEAENKIIKWNNTSNAFEWVDFDHGGLTGLDDDDHDGATYGYIIREPDSGVADGWLAAWDGTTGRNLKQINAFYTGSRLYAYCDLAFWDGSHALYLDAPATISGSNTLTFPDKTGTIATLDDITGGSGDVVGPSSSTDNAIARYDGETGKLIQDSANAILGDDGTLELNGFLYTEQDSIGAVLRGNSLELGYERSSGDSGVSYIDFWSSGLAEYDARIIAGSTELGTSTPGNGSIEIEAQGGISLKGETTFDAFPITPSSAPDADYEVANKKYVDDNAGGSGTNFGWYDVTASPYNAKADGTDDAAEINAAITAAKNAGGGIVYFPPGTYTVESSVIVPDDSRGVTLMGAGGGSSQAYYTNDSPSGVSEIKAGTSFSMTSALVDFQGHSDGCGVRDLMLNGNSKAEFLLRVYKGYNSNFENINGVLWNGSTGSYAVQLRNDGGSSGRADNNQVWRNCHFVRPAGTYGSGLDLNPTSTAYMCEIKFIGCVFEAYNRAYNTSGGHVVRLGHCDHISFVGCLFQHAWIGSVQTPNANFCSFLIYPRANSGYPSNITVSNSPQYGGVAYNNTYTWSNNNPAINFFPFYTQDSQLTPPNAPSGSATLVKGMVGGFTDSGNGLDAAAKVTAPTLLNSWTQYVTGSVQYFKDAAGVVHVSGLVKAPSSGSGASIIFELPVKYRPGYLKIFQVNQNWTQTDRCYVNTSGTVQAQNPTYGGAYYSLDGISFLAEW